MSAQERMSPVERLRDLVALLSGRKATVVRDRLLSELEGLSHRHDCRELSEETLRLRICAGRAPDRRRRRR